MDKQEATAIVHGEKAHENYSRILQCQANIGANSYVMAGLLKENRDNGYYKFLGYDSFESFLGSPELGFKRSKAYELIRLYDLFVNRLGLSERDWVTIGTTNLSLIARAKRCDEEWLDKARNLSTSDLIKELGGAEVSPSRTLSPPAPPPPSGIMSPQEYVKMVKGATCLGCGAKEVDAHHFPRTRVRGEEHWVIPLCRMCHSMYHQDPKDWIWKNRQFWGGWFYGLLVREDERNQ